MLKKTNFGEYSIEQIIKPYLVTPSNKRWYIPCPKCNGKYYLMYYSLLEPWPGDLYKVNLRCDSCGFSDIVAGTLRQMRDFFDYRIKMENP